MLLRGGGGGDAIIFMGGTDAPLEDAIIGGVEWSGTYQGEGELSHDASKLFSHTFRTLH